MKVTYTEEAIADIVDAITYIHERNPTAAAKVDADIARCNQRRPDELLILRIYHQRRRPIAR